MALDAVDGDNERCNCAESGQTPPALFKGTKWTPSVAIAGRCTIAAECVNREHGRRTRPCADELWQTGEASPSSLDYT